MKRRTLCQLCAGYLVLLVSLFLIAKDNVFQALGESRCERAYQEGDVAYIEGKLYKKETSCLYLEDIRFRLEDDVVTSKERLPVYLAERNADSGQLPEIGTIVQVKGSVKIFQNAPNPGNFNQKFYFQKQNIHLMLQNAQILECSGSADEWKELLWKIRQRLCGRILSQMGEKGGGALCAMMLGETAYLESEMKELFQKSGIGHLLAVSGLHMFFWGIGFYELTKKMRISKKMSGILSLLFLTVFVQVVGSGISAFRAYLMFGMRMGAILFGREYDGLTALALAALVQLGINPLQLFDAGFLLSYGAVYSIYVISPVLQDLVGKKLGISLALSMMLFPIMLYFYYEICLYSVIWNLAAVPLASIVLACGALGTLTSIPVFFQITKGIFCFYEKGSEFFLHLPMARWVAGQPKLYQILLYYLILGGTIYLLKKKKRKTSLILTVGAVLLLVVPQQFQAGMEIVMINVGQGDCFLIRERGGMTCLIDGGSSTVEKVGVYRIEPCLKYQGIGTLDYVFVSHGDEDHVSGIRELLERQNVGIRVKHLVLPPKRLWDESIISLAFLAEEKSIPIYVMEQGQKIMEGEVSIVCLWPSRETEKSGNEASLVLSVSKRRFDMLFNGDLEKDSEAAVCDYITRMQYQGQLPLKYEALKVGHHGSRYGTGEALLECLQIDIAFVSAGNRNVYGHPHEEVLLRLANRGINLYNTKDGSTAKICTDGEKYYIIEP